MVLRLKKDFANYNFQDLANFDFWESEIEFVIKKGLFGCPNDDGAEFLFEMGCMFQKR